MTISTFRRSSSSAADVHVACSSRADGDFHPYHNDASELSARRSVLVDLPWVWLDHAHGTDIIVVDGDAGEASGARADGAITTMSDVVLSVWVADCAPIVLIGASREIGILHAGWRGLAAGIIDDAVAAFSDRIDCAAVGPVIEPCCYEFGFEEAERVAAGTHSRIEDVLVARPDLHPDGNSANTPGNAVRVDADAGVPTQLDVGAAVVSAFAVHDIDVVTIGGCTGCGGEHFSHRVRSEPMRHTVGVWQGER